MKKNRRHRNPMLQPLAILLSLILLFAFSPVSAVAASTDSCKDGLCRSQVELLGTIKREHRDEKGNLVWCLINDGNATFTVSLYDLGLYCSDTLSIEELHTPYLDEFATEIDWDLGVLLLLDVNGAFYRYTDLFTSESWQQLTNLYLPLGEDSYACIEYYHDVQWMCDYPVGGKAKNTFMTRLLQAETASGAVEEWKTHVCTDTEKLPETPVEIATRPPIWQGLLCFVSGAAAATLLTYLLMRKKLKNPHRFGGNEKILEGIPVIETPPEDVASEE